MNVNARSLVNKVDQFEALLLEIKPDIVAVTETWLYSDILDHEVSPPGYVIVRKDRETRGGGVALFFKKELRYSVLPGNPSIEAVWCKVQLQKGCVFVGVIYRPPNAETSYLELLLDYMHDHVTGGMIIMAGDLNLPEIEWSSKKVRSAANDVILDMLFNFNLEQLVRVPTRVQGVSSSILDVVLVSDHFPEDQARIEILDGISDHNSVLCTLPLSGLSRIHSPDRHVLAFNRADDAAIITYLNHEFLAFYDLCMDKNLSMDHIWLQFKARVIHCIENFVPTQRKITRKHNAWITRDIIHIKRKISRLRKARRSSSRASYTAQIATLSKTLKSKVRSSKIHYFGTTLAKFIKTSPGKFWRYVSGKHSGQNASPSIDTKDKADNFNRYFQSVFTIDNGLVHHPEIRPPTDKKLSKTPEITESGILNLLLNLDDKKSCGPDGIPNAFLKRYAEPVSKYLRLLFTKSIQDSQIPSEWKLAKIIPVHKSGDKSTPSNYRPISLTCTSCKLLEHIILKFITKFVEENNLLHPNQHGFRRGLSTVTQLAETIHDLAEAINQHSQIDIIFMDFSKAFDRVSHEKLVFQLVCKLGDGPVTRWISNYLSGRQQFVHCSDHVSDTLNVTSGVPQGSVLAPILFLLFINDLTVNINANIRLFADDCILYKQVKSSRDQTELNDALNDVVRWCSNWQMVINSDKTVAMQVTKKKSRLPFHYGYNNIVLRNVSQYKYLGVIITSDLSWTVHLENITEKALKKLFFLKRTLRHADRDTKLLAYVTLVRPILEYASIIWFPFTDSGISTLERVQRKAIRFIFNRYRRLDSPTQLLRHADLPTLESRAKIHRLKFLYLLLHNCLKIDHAKYVKTKTTRQTRHTHDHTLQEYSCNNNTFYYSFFPRCIREWNALDRLIAEQRTVDDFLAMLQNTHST